MACDSHRLVSDVFLFPLVSLVLLRQALLLNPDLVVLAGLASQQALGSAYLCLPSTKTIDMCHCAQLLHRDPNPGANTIETLCHVIPIQNPTPSLPGIYS